MSYVLYLQEEQVNSEPVLKTGLGTGRIDNRLSNAYAEN